MQKIKFLLGGIPGAIFSYFILWLIPEDSDIYIDIRYYVVSFFLKETTSFFVHKYWTFKQKRKKKKEVWEYFFTTLYLLILNTIVYLFFAEMLKINKLIAQLIVTILFAILNYIEVKRVFKK